MSKIVAFDRQVQKNAFSVSVRDVWLSECVVHQCMYERA